MGYETDHPGRERNYVDCGRIYECQHAWLIERHVVSMRAFKLPLLSWWDGIGWTTGIDDAIRFTRWIDAARVIDHTLPSPTDTIKYQANFHDNLYFPFNEFYTSEKI